MVGQSPYPLGSHLQTLDTVVRSTLLHTEVIFLGGSLRFLHAQDGRSSLISPCAGQGPISPRLVCHCHLRLLRLLIVEVKAGLVRV
jgi:hypothetical protein